jgi:hypothetical protein
MSESKKSIYDGARYLYAEQLKGKRVTLTIKAVVSETIIGDGGRKSQGFALAFAETDKQLVISGMTIRRQLAMATETDDPDAMVGKKIILYPVNSAKSISGQAIRIAVPEAHA